MICYMNPGEKINPQIILARLSEDGICLLTGSNNDLQYMPVNFDVNNILPSNMVCISNKMANAINTEFVYYYTIRLWEYEITLETPKQFESYNQSIIEMLEDKTSDFISFVNENLASGYKQADLLPQLFEFLISHHIKGIYKISNRHRTLENLHYQTFVIRSLVEAEKNKKQSKIITPGLNLVH